MFKKIAIAAALGTALFAGSVQAAVLYSDKGAWTTAAGGTVVNTTTDPNPVFSDVNAITLNDGVVLSLGSSANVREIGNGWATWSGGYTGTVYSNNGLTSFSISISAVGAFGLELEPDPFAFHDITLTLNDGSFLTQSVNGDAGAAFFGWVGTDVTSITISSDAAFAFGNFYSVADGTAPVPEPATLALLGAGLAGLALRRRKRAA